MEASLRELLDDNIYSGIRCSIISIICQTLLYGIYLCLVPIAVHAMIVNGLQTRERKCLLTIITSMFALATAYWIFSVIFTFLKADSLENVATVCYGNQDAFDCLIHELSVVHLPFSTWLAMLGDILFVNFIIADGVVIWRAWVLCSDQRKVVLMIPAGMLAINTLIYLTTLVVRAIELFSNATVVPVYLGYITDVTQLAHLTLSLIINIYATSIIALKAWKYRKLLLESGIGVRTPSQAIRILALLVESGVIYVLIGITNLVSITISMRFQRDDIASAFVLMSIQLVGMYPSVVVVLVEKNRSLNTTYFSFGTVIDIGRDRTSRGEPMSFVPGPVLASGAQMDPATKPPNTAIQFTVDLALQSADTGTVT